jgi:MFS family permease
MVDAPPRSLWRHRDFLLLWGGQTISDMGSAVTLLALPLLAVTALDASAFQVGLLTSLGTVAYLLIALPAGAIIDRVPKRRLMLSCDLGKAVVLSTIPIVSVSGHLVMGQLYAVAFASGCLAVFFEIAYQSYLPSLLARTQLVDGNSKIGTTNSLATVVGPTLAGAIIAVLGSAARAIVVDCFSFVVSVLTLFAIRTPEAPATGLGGGRRVRTMGRDIATGFGYVARNPVLRRIVTTTATSNLFNAVIASMLVVFLARDLHAAPGTIGLVLGLGGIGGVTGGLVGRRLARVFGSARMLWLGKLVFGAVALLIPLATPGKGVFLVSVGVFALALSAVLYNVSQVSYRQAMCPPELLGRMNASVRWVIRGVMPIGGLLGGILATWLGVRAALAIGAVGAWASVFWIIISPMRAQREIPVHQAYGEPEPAAAAPA